MERRAGPRAAIRPASSVQQRRRLSRQRRQNFPVLSRRRTAATTTAARTSRKREREQRMKQDQPTVVGKGAQTRGSARNLARTSSWPPVERLLTRRSAARLGRGRMSQSQMGVPVVDLRVPPALPACLARTASIWEPAGVTCARLSMKSFLAERCGQEDITARRHTVCCIFRRLSSRQLPWPR